MSIIVLGDKGIAFTVGYVDCVQKGVKMPFMAFGNAQYVMMELEIDEGSARFQTDLDVQKTRDVFDRHGTVVFFDNLASFDAAMAMLTDMVGRACTTEWVARKPQRETIQ